MATPTALARMSLDGYIQTRLMTDQEVQESRTRINTRRALQVTYLLGIGVGEIGVVPISITGSEDILERPLSDIYTRVFAIFNSIGMVLTTGFFAINASLEFINVATQKRDLEQEELVEYSLPGWKRNIILITAVAGGLIIQFPEAAGAQRASQDFLLPQLSFASRLIVFAGGSYSVYMSMLRVAKLGPRSRDLIELELKRSRSEFAKAIAEKRKSLVLATQERDDFLNAMRGFLQRRTPTTETTPLMEEGQIQEEMRCSDFLETILGFNQPAGQNLSETNDLLLSILAAPMWICLLALICSMAKEGVEGLVPWEGFPYLAAAVTFLVLEHIWWKGINQTMRSGVNWIRGDRHPPLTNELMPTLYKVITYVLSGLAFTIIVEPWPGAKHFFPTPSWIHWPIGALASGGAILGSIAGIYSLRNRLIRKLTKNIGRDAPKKHLLLVDEKLKELHEIINKIKVKEYARFLLNVPEMHRWTGLTLEQLQSYLRIQPTAQVNLDPDDLGLRTLYGD